MPMKRNIVSKGLIGLLGAGLSLAAAGCSSDQKPAALGAPAAAGSSATSSAAASPSTSTATSAAASSSSSSPPSAASSSSAAPAPTTIATSEGGWSYKATVPGDTDAAAAMAAFQKYREITFQMSAKPDYSTDLANYADGNVLTLANNFIDLLKRKNSVMVGSSVETVTSTKLDMAASPLPLMTIAECKDASKYRQVYTYGPDKGGLAATTIDHPYPVTFTVHKTGDGKWRVTSVHSESDKTC